MSRDPIRVLFICAGNICRSPMAEAVFRHLVAEAGLSDRFEIDSAATGSWHVGELPHRGTRDVLQRQQVAQTGKRARQVDPRDLHSFDYLVAMDRENLMDLHHLTSVPGGRLMRLLDFAPDGSPEDVPDPYYDGGFDRVYALVRAGCEGLLLHVRSRHGL